jgi:replicative DNA helicase
MDEYQIEEATLNEINMYDYINDRMLTDMQQFIESGKIKTGYKNIDDITNLYPGLYVLGAIPSLGKTTFMHQMSDQLVQSGEDVIYFSYEQSALELVTKSLSRIMYLKYKDAALTSLQIRKSGLDDHTKEAINTYSKFARNLHIVECNFNATITQIENTVEQFIHQNEKKPIVVIDYLQVIQSYNIYMSTKDNVDINVKKLKQLQRKHQIVIIVISSLNRQNYTSLIDFESFKESGGIEYTADVVWGLQLVAMRQKDFNSNGNTNAKRDLLEKAKSEIPRHIELCCIKNRFGISNYKCVFEYNPKYDLFIPDSRIRL